MTNRVALAIAGLVAAIVALDLALGLGGSLFLARRFVVLLDLMAFWN